MELQVLTNQINQLQNQIVNVLGQVVEFEELSKRLDEIKKVKEDEEMFVSFGHGVYIKAGLKDNKKVLMKIGGNAAIKKEIGEGKVIINKQIEELKKASVELERELGLLKLQAQHLEAEL